MIGVPRRRPRAAVVVGAAAAMSLAAGTALLAEQVWLGGKAMVAATLIERALERHLDDGQPHPPWQWADTWPEARLELPRLGIARPILNGSSGASMAFGLGRLDGTTAPNGPGNCVVNGHRDSWARFLGEVRPGDRLRLSSHGATVEYTVTSASVVHEREAWVTEPSNGTRLTLVTCYPFSDLLPSPRLFVVVAVPDSTESRESA
jgi:sortase A